MSYSIEPYSSFITDFVKPLGKSGYKFTPVHRLVAAGEEAELCYLSGKETGSEPCYWLIAKDGLKVTLSRPGLVKSIERKGENGLDVILDRPNAYGIFRDANGSIPENRSLRSILNGVYGTISSLEFNKYENKSVFDWDGEKIISRFSDFNSLFGESDIIPEYNDSMIVVSESSGCPRKCIYCVEPGKNGFEGFDLKKIEDEFSKAKDILLKHHDAAISTIEELMHNNSDYLLLNLLGGISLERLNELIGEYFPHTQKHYSFFGVPSVLKISGKDLSRVYDGGNGVNRALVGIETGDDRLSAFVGKNESSVQKLDALRKLQNAGFKVKPIVQVGLVGEGFYANKAEFVSSKESLEKTAELIKAFFAGSDPRKKEKVLISRYTPIEGTELKALHDGHKLIRPYSSATGLEEDVAFLLDKLREKRVDIYHSIELGYESALEGRVKNP